MTKEELIQNNLGLIYKIAKFFYNVDKQDLIQAGCIGLIKAYDNYQKNGTTKFSTYAYEYVYGEMYALVNKNRDIKISRDILRLYKSIEKSRYMLAQKLGRIPSNEDLASFLDFELKLQHKYDYLLTDELLNMEYAKSCLDVNGAWKVLEKNFTRIK